MWIATPSQPFKKLANLLNWWSIKKHCIDVICNPLTPFQNACHLAELVLLWGRWYPCASYFWWLSDHGQSSRTLVMLRPTKPQSQSCTASHNPTKQTPMLSWWQLRSLLTISVSLPYGTALRKTTPLCILLSMTKWSGSEFTYCSNAVSNQATKPKLCELHLIP